MNKRYKLHYGDYAVEENERLYEDMSENGWLLKKHGTYFSSFKKAEPQRIKYRIEISVPNELPENTKKAYEDCGWSLVTSNGFVNVFSTDEGSKEVDIKLELSEKKKLMKALVRNYVTSLIFSPFFLTLNFALIFMDSSFGGFKANLYEMLLQNTALMLLFSVLLLMGLYCKFHEALGALKLHRQLKSNKSLDRENRSSHTLYRGICSLLIIIMVPFSLLSIAQLASRQKYDMPLVADGPYLLLKDIEGDRAQLSDRDKSSSVKVTESLMAKRYDTFECLELMGIESWMYNTVYELKSTINIDELVNMLMRTSTFVKEPGRWTKVSVEGLDAAYFGKTGPEYIAVKGNRAWYITYRGQEAYSDDFDHTRILEALAKL